MGCFAVGQADDLGARIIAADKALGPHPGEIHVAASGTISEGEVSLSVGHDLICNDGIIIFLNAGSYLYQNSHTRIKNCVISATSTPILGEVQSVNTEYVELDSVTFLDGGNLVGWNGVKHFRISDNKVVSITAVDPVADAPSAGYYLVNCSRGEVNNLMASGFVFPAGLNLTGVVEVILSDHITFNNPMISDVDASYVHDGAGVIVIQGSKHIVVNGGVITRNANMDGVLSQSYQNNVRSSHVTIAGLYSSYNGGIGRNTKAPLGLGDGLDLINTRHIYVSHCILDGNGSLHDEQPGIWLFLDDDVLVADSDVSNGSMAGIAAAGSRNVHLIRDSINSNQATGVFTEWQSGTATNVGPAVTFIAGVSGGFGLAWVAGTPFILDGVAYPIDSVTDSKHLTLATSPPDHSSPVVWGVNSTQEIHDSVINNNGLGKFGGQIQVGISWADGTSGKISGVTATDTGAGTQLYGLELANTANAILYNDNFSGNVKGGDGINASSQAVSPTRLSFPNEGIGSTSPAQTVTLTAGAIVVWNLLIQASGDFSETNNCGTRLPAFAMCQVQVTFTPTAAGTQNGTLAITNSAPNSPQTTSLTGNGVAYGLGLSVATGGFNHATVADGTTAKYLLSLGGSGVSGMASLTCTGAPRGATCNIPAVQAVNANQSTAFNVSVTTMAPTTGTLRPAGFGLQPWLWAMIGWVVLPARVRATRWSRRYLIWLPLAVLMFLSSCGGSSSEGSNGTPLGNYTLTVTAKVGSTSEQVPLTLTVK